MRIYFSSLIELAGAYFFRKLKMGLQILYFSLTVQGRVTFDYGEVHGTSCESIFIAAKLFSPLQKGSLVSKTIFPSFGKLLFYISLRVQS